MEGYRKGAGKEGITGHGERLGSNRSIYVPCLGGRKYVSSVCDTST